MRRILLCALVAAACGGKEGTLSLDIVVSPVDDPFADATQVRFTVGDDKHVKLFPVSGGHFDIKIEQSPLGKAGPVIVEALDSAGNVVAHGRTPDLQLQPYNQGPIAVWVGRPGRVVAAAAALGKPVVDFASVAVPGLGVVYAGGRVSDGTAIKDTSVYDVFLHKQLDTAPMSTARAGAAGAVVLGIRTAVFGGSTGAGFGNTDAPLGTTEVFDPTVGAGLWSAAPSDPIVPRSFANSTKLGNGSVLLSGGFGDAGGTRLDSAAILTTSGTARVNAVASPMAAPRAGHAVTPAKFSDGGEGALLFGGLQPGSSAPVAERLVGQSFAPIEVSAPNRTGATATTLATGDVLILGGAGDDGKPLATGIVIGLGALPPTMTALPTALSAPRVGHTTTAVGSDLLVCGGSDDKGAPLASCDLLDGTSLAIKKTLLLGTARTRHSAAALETGPIVIAGGLGADGMPLASMEIYTP